MNEMISVKEPGSQAAGDVSNQQKDQQTANGIPVGTAGGAGAGPLGNGLKESQSEDKTGIELSKQQTFKGNSMVGDDDSSSSDSSSDDSNIFGQAHQKANKPTVQQTNQSVSAPSQVQPSAPQTQAASIVAQTESKNEQQQLTVAPGTNLAAQPKQEVATDQTQVPVAPEGQSKPVDAGEKPVAQADYHLMAQQHQIQASSEDKVPQVQPQVAIGEQSQPQVADSLDQKALDGSQQVKNDIEMKDANAVEPAGQQDQLAGAQSEVQKIADSNMQSNDQQPNVDNSLAADEPQKLQAIQSQALWGAGNQGHDSKMVADDDMDEEEEEDDLDPEFKQKCLAAQDTEELFTLNINTYQVCKLNILLSAIGLKMDPKEQVLTWIRKREAEERRKVKKPKKKRLHSAIDQVEQFGGSTVGGNLNKMQADHTYGMYYKQGLTKDSNMLKPDGTMLNDPKNQQAMLGTYNPNDPKSGAPDQGTIKKPQDLIADPNASKALLQSATSAGGMPADQKAAVGPSDFHASESDLRALSPTPRKSERERPPVSYQNIVNGKRADSDDEPNAQPSDAAHHAAQSSTNSAPKHKKPQDQMFRNPKKLTADDANKRIRDLLEKLNQHEHAVIMNQPLSRNSPLWEQYKDDWKALAMIDAMHRCGKYTNSKEIIGDINNLILTKFSMLSASGDSEGNTKVMVFQKYFDSISHGLENLALTNKVERSKKTNEKPSKPKKDHQDHDATTEPAASNSRSKPDHKAKEKTKSSANQNHDNLDDPKSIEIKPVQVITQEQMAELKRDIIALSNEQRDLIEKEVPECITTNAQGNKNIELSNLKANPEIAKNLIDFVKKLTKKNQQRESRRKKDAKRREERRMLDMANKGFKGNDPSKSTAAAVHSNASVIANTQGQASSDFVAAQNVTAANMHQGQFQQNPQLAQFQPGLGFKPGFPGNAGQMTAAPNQQQQQFFNQMMMNQMLSQSHMTPALQQFLAMQQMQQQQAPVNGQTQVAGMAGKQVAGMAGAISAIDGQAAQGDAQQKKGAAGGAAQSKAQAAASDDSQSDTSSSGSESSR